MSSREKAGSGSFPVHILLIYGKLSLIVPLSTLSAHFLAHFPCIYY